MRIELYVAKWLRRKYYNLVLNRCSWIPQVCLEQYCKAYFASFPPDLWPGEEEEEPGEGKIYLRLKDGTRFQVVQVHRAKQLCNKGDVGRSADLEATRSAGLNTENDRIWEAETLRIVGRLLSERGRIVDPRLPCGGAAKKRRHDGSQEEQSSL